MPKCFSGCGCNPSRFPLRNRPFGGGFSWATAGRGGRIFWAAAGGAGADGGSGRRGVRRVWYNIGNGPIVQRIGHRPSKSTMLVRFQLGPPEQPVAQSLAESEVFAGALPRQVQRRGWLVRFFCGDCDETGLTVCYSCGNCGEAAATGLRRR